MGYTHYWQRKPATPDDAAWAEFCAFTRHAMAEVQGKTTATAGGYYKDYPIDLMGEEDNGPPEVSEEAVCFNGRGDLGCEHFVFIRDDDKEIAVNFPFKARLPKRNGERNFRWCKTERRPYDVLVVACLCKLAELGIIISWESDGKPVDLQQGKDLFERCRKCAAPAMPSDEELRRLVEEAIGPAAPPKPVNEQLQPLLGMTRERIEEDEPFGVSLEADGEWTVIDAYTRKQAVADEEQFDVTETAKEAGFKFPVYLTRSVWYEYVVVPEGVWGQDEKGRLWDVLWMLRHAISRSTGNSQRLPFQLHVRNDNREGDPPLVTLYSVIGPKDIDDPQPAITIMSDPSEE